MKVSMHDPESIVAWLKVWPVRHYPALDDWMKTVPSTVPAIMEVQHRLATDPELIPLLQEVLRDQRRRSGVLAASSFSYKPEDAMAVAV